LIPKETQAIFKQDKNNITIQDDLKSKNDGESFNDNNSFISCSKIDSKKPIKKKKNNKKKNKANNENEVENILPADLEESKLNITNESININQDDSIVRGNKPKKNKKNNNKKKKKNLKVCSPIPEDSDIDSERDKKDSTSEATKELDEINESSIVFEKKKKTRTKNKKTTFKKYFK